MNDHEPYKDYEYDDDFECEEEHSNHNFDDKVKSGKLNSNIRNWNTYVSKNNDEEVDKPAIESDSSQIPGKKSVHSIIDSPTTTGPSGRSRGKSNSDVSSKLKERTKKRSKGTVGWIQREEWSIGENIGKGSFGSVFQCMNNKVLYSSFLLMIFNPALSISRANYSLLSVSKCQLVDVNLSMI
jgi:hypothetical protein